MNASWVVVVANRWGWVNLHTAVAHRVIVGIAVGVAAPVVAVTHTVEVVVAVRIVAEAPLDTLFAVPHIAAAMVAVVVQSLTNVTGLGHCPSLIPRGIRAILLSIEVPTIRYF